VWAASWKTVIREPRRRQESAAGTLSPTYRDALAVILGWARPSTRREEDERGGSSGLRSFRNSGHWPRHAKTENQHERTLGIWLHGQRIDYRAGKLDPVKLQELNDTLPGWREGCGNRGGWRC
jgi:hypothetical protein